MSVHYERARFLHLQGRYGQAERELREELAESPHSGQTHAFLSRCLALQKRTPEALAEAEEGVRLAPSLPYAHYVLGLAYRECGRLKGAEAALREALRLDPRDVDQLAALSWTQGLRGDRRAALATVERALEIDPEHVNCLNHQGYFLRGLGNRKGSETVLRAALRLAPENYFTHANLAWTLWAKVHARTGVGPFQPWIASFMPPLREALAHFRESLQLNPADDWARTGMADTLMVWGKAVWRLIAAAFALAALIVFPSSVLHTSSADANDGLGLNLLLALFGIALAAASNGPPYLLLQLTRMGAAVLSPARRRAAKLTAFCLVLAACAGVAGLLTARLTALGFLFLILTLIEPLTLACETPAGWPRKLTAAYAALLAVAGLVCLAVLIIVGVEKAPGSVVVCCIGVGTGSIYAPKVAQFLTKRFAAKTA